jgi:hypothetical protein
MGLSESTAPTGDRNAIIHPIELLYRRQTNLGSPYVGKKGKITEVLTIVYNATIYINFNNTVAFDSLKSVKMF